jgi:hypothetical protein
MTVRWSEDEFALYMQHLGRSRAHVQPVPEKVFQAAVLRLAKQYGWMCYFTWSSKRSPEGFPDLVLAHPDPARDTPLIVAELKREGGQCTPAQVAWLAALASCTGVEAEVWRPAMLQEIAARLRGMAG